MNKKAYKFLIGGVMKTLIFILIIFSYQAYAETSNELLMFGHKVFDSDKAKAELFYKQACDLDKENCHFHCQNP